MTVTICLKTPAFGRGRVAFGDRQMVTVTFFRARLMWEPYEAVTGTSVDDASPSAAFPTVAWGWLPGRSSLLARGPDAASFVGNFTTAAVTALAPGRGTEGFFTDARGHVLALANILRTEDGLWLDAAAGVAPQLLAHLDHYLIRERVELRDATPDRRTLLLAGPRARAWLESRAPGPVPADLLRHGRIGLGDAAIEAVALDWFGAGSVLLQGAPADADRLAALFHAEGLPELDAGAIDALRIESVVPGPADIDARTLPQELGRDARAISFTKGCYLGQETVARLDALGHVNRRLVALATERPAAVGTPVTAAGDVVGRISSACTARHGGGLGLALVHVRGLACAALEVGGMPARVAPDPPSIPREEA